MDVRIARPDEAHELVEMCRWFSTSPFQFDDRLEGVAGGFEPAFGKEILRSPSTVIYVATESVKITGFIALHPLSPLSEQTGKRIGNILLLVVRPEHRGQGLGKTLVAKALEHLRALRIEIAAVGTDLYNIPALQVYTAQGFLIRLVWHIFRFYYDREGKMSEAIRPINISEIEPFTSLFNRPLSLLRDKTIAKDKLQSYLFEKWKSQIAQGKIHCLGYCRSDTPIALIAVQQDTLAEKTLQTQRPVYKILDIMLSADADETVYPVLFLDVVARFPGSLLELWVDSLDNRVIQHAEESGFRLAYSGVNLHAYL